MIVGKKSLHNGKIIIIKFCKITANNVQVLLSYQKIFGRICDNNVT